MSADPRDDFSPFEGSEHMFFGLDDPFGYIRQHLEEVLTSQVPSTRINSIRCHGEPKFLTLGRKLEDDPDKVVVTYCASCFQCTIDVETDEHREQLPSTVTLCLGEIDRADDQRAQLFLHIYHDADPAFEEDEFRARFLEFRYGAEQDDDEDEGDDPTT